MIRNDQIQAGMISKLQGTSAITDLVSSDEIREDEWAGREFDYPNIRVQLRPTVPSGKEGCPQTFESSILVFSESSSSLEADQIAGIIADELHDIGFISNSLQFYVQVASLIPAVRSATNECRSEVLLRGRVS